MAQMNTKRFPIILGGVLLGVLGPLAYVSLKSDEPIGSAPADQAAPQPDEFGKVLPTDFKSVPLTAGELKKLYYWGQSSGYYDFDAKTKVPKVVLNQFFVSNGTPYLISNIKLRITHTYHESTLKFSEVFDLKTQVSPEFALIYGALPPGQSSYNLPLMVKITPDGWRTDRNIELEFLSADRVLPGPSLEKPINLQAFMMQNTDEVVLEKFRTNPSLLQMGKLGQAGPLQFAIMANRISLIDPLIQMGARIEERSRSGNSAMHFAAVTSPEMIAKVASYKADANATNTFAGSPLTLAIRMRKKSHFKALLEAGANIEELNPDGATPILVACSLRFMDEMLELKKLGADPNVVDRRGDGIFMNLMRNGTAEDVKFLIKNKIGDPKLVNDRGENIAHYAAWRHRDDILEVLYENKVDVELRDKSGRTPADRAVDRGRLTASAVRTLEFFRRKGLKVPDTTNLR